MLPILHIGPLAIQVPGLVLLLGLWLGLSLTERYAPRYGMDSKILYNLVIISILAGVVGARLLYVARFPDAFLSKPASIISLNPSLLDLWGGVFHSHHGCFDSWTSYGTFVLAHLKRTNPSSGSILGRASTRSFIVRFSLRDAHETSLGNCIMGGFSSPDTNLRIDCRRNDLIYPLAK